MEAIIEDLSQSKKLIRFSVPHERVASQIEAALGEVRKTASIKGFRAGHVPEHIVRARFGDTIRTEALSRLVPQVLRQAMLENKLRPVGEPEVNDLRFEGEEPLTFTATVEVIPAFELPEYKGIRVVAHKIEPATEAEIDEIVERYRNARATLVPVEDRPVQLGDSIIVTLEQTTDGKTETMKEQSVEVDETRLIPGLAQALVGIEAGGTKSFELTIPEDYPNKEQAGTTISYAATVGEIKKKQLPELTGECTKEVAGVETVEAFRGQIASGMLEQRQHEERVRQEHVVDDALLEATASFEVPASLLEKQSNMLIARAYQRAQASGMPREKIVEQHDEIVKNAAEASARRIKLALILERIAEAEDIRITDEDLAAYYERAAGAQGMSADQVREVYEKREGAIESLRDELLDKRLQVFLMEHAEIE